MSIVEFNGGPITHAYLAKKSKDELARMYMRLLDNRNFFERRCDALQKAQNHMRDPERKMVCDILANGETYEAPNTKSAADSAG